jgi:hypothetical protein
MLNLIIEGKKYKSPTQWSDVKYKDFLKFQKFIHSEHNKSKTEILLNDGITSDNEELMLNYFIDCVNYITNIPKKTLLKVRRYTKANEISVEDLFYSMSFLFVYPTIDEPKPVEKIGKYYFIDKLDVNQAELKNASFSEYTEANFVTKCYNELGAGNEEYLILLLAVMYRPKKKRLFRNDVIEGYDSETVRERAKELESVTMDVVWNCLFFFLQSKVKSLKNTEEYFQELQKKRIDYLNTIGYQLGIMWLRVVYLIKKVIRRMKVLVGKICTMF